MRVCVFVCVCVCVCAPSGAPLRQDNRDRKFGGRGGRDSGRGGWEDRGRGRGGGGGAWARAPDCTAEIDDRMVMNLVMARDDARRSRDFETADDIREVLQSDWGVAGMCAALSIGPHTLPTTHPPTHPRETPSLSPPNPTHGSFCSVLFIVRGILLMRTNRPMTVDDDLREWWIGK